MSQTEDFAEDLENFLLRFVGLTATKTRSKEIFIKGSIQKMGTLYHLEINCPHFPKITRMRLRVMQRYEIINFGDSAMGISSEWTVSDLVENVPNLMRATAERNDELLSTSLSQKNSMTMQSGNIYAEIAALHVSDKYKIEIDNACTRVRFSKFVHFEQHYLELELPSMLVLEHSLPHCTPWQDMLAKCPTLTVLLQQFQKYLEDLQSYYDNFTDIDELCYVLQPKLPTTKDNWRLLVLRERVFLKLVIADPFAPLASMSLHIIGPTFEVEKLRRIYSEGLSDWDVELDIHKNLLRIFNLCFFPMPPGNASSGDAALSQQYCNICYGYELEENGQIPIISCDSPQCNLIFHAACLKEWFNTLFDGKEFLTVSFGTCPFCKAKLSTSFAELLDD